MLNQTGHSANVQMSLNVNGFCFDVAGCLGDICTLRNPIDTQPTYATLRIIIDGVERSKAVYLTNGISKGCADVAFEEVEFELATSKVA